LKVVWFPIQYMVPNQHFDTININSNGMRGTEITKEKPHNTYRIFMVGGSTTFGSGSTSDHTTIPGFLQKKFDSEDLGFHVEVINAGFPAGWSHTEAIYIKQELLSYDPDLLIIYDGRNDIPQAKNILNNPKITRIEIDTKIDNSFLDEIFYFYEKSNLFLKTPRIIEDNFFKYEAESFGACYKDEQCLSKMTNDWVNRWKTICEIGKKNGFDTLVILQPFRGTSDRPFNEEDRRYVNQKTQGMIFAYDSFANSLSQLNDHCSSTADLRGAFDGMPYSYYFDKAHLVDAGNEIMAEKIYDLSLPLVIKNLKN